MIKHTTGTKFLNAYLRIGMKGSMNKGTKKQKTGNKKEKSSRKKEWNEFVLKERHN